MKKADIATVILIAGLSILAAYFIAKAVIGDPKEESVTVRTASEVSSEIAKPNEYVFYCTKSEEVSESTSEDDENQAESDGGIIEGECAIDPTVDIVIGSEDEEECVDGVNSDGEACGTEENNTSEE